MEDGVGIPVGVVVVEVELDQLNLALCVVETLAELVEEADKDGREDTLRREE